MTTSREQEDILITLDQVSQALDVLQNVVLRLREQVSRQAQMRPPAPQRTSTQDLPALQDAQSGDTEVLH